MSNHTPGPWEQGDGSDRNLFCGSGDILGTVRPGTRGVVARVNPGISDSLANARLIAAAPYMLEACWGTSKAPKEAVAIMKREGFVIDNLDDRWQKLAFTLYSMLVNNASMAEHAIAKAEGRNA